AARLPRQSGTAFHRFESLRTSRYLCRWSALSGAAEAPISRPRDLAAPQKTQIIYESSGGESRQASPPATASRPLGFVQGSSRRGLKGKQLRRSIVKGLISKLAVILPLAYAVPALAEESIATERQEAADLRKDARQDFQKARQERQDAVSDFKQAHQESVQAQKDRQMSREEARDARQDLRKAGEEAREGDVAGAQKDMAKASAEMKESAQLKAKANAEAADAKKLRQEGHEDLRQAKKDHAEGVKDLKEAHHEAKEARREAREERREKNRHR